jgi:X-X-X-Leu-X-X-Gly heptad repeat protein
MSHAARRPLIAAAVATCSLALVGAPAAGAKSKISKPERAQNTAIKKVSRTASRANRTANSAKRSAAAGLAAAAAAGKKADGAQGGVNLVLAGVPQITDGLTRLADGLRQAATGLTQLKDGLTTVGSALAAQEYGAVYVQLAGQDVQGTLLNSADIPDDSNAAIVTGTVLVPVPGSVTTATPVKLLAGVRSGEADGTGAANPVASAGIVSMTVTDLTGGGVTVGGGNTLLPGSPITSAPNTALGGAPVYNIPLKAPRVDATPNPFAFPDADAIDLTDPSTLFNLTGAGSGPFTVRNNTASTAPVTVTFTVRFNDLTASATDVTA